MSYRAKIDLIEAREIIAYFLLWHDPAYKPSPEESLEDLLSRAKTFLLKPKSERKRKPTDMEAASGA